MAAIGAHMRTLPNLGRGNLHPIPEGARADARPSAQHRLKRNAALGGRAAWRQLDRPRGQPSRRPAGGMALLDFSDELVRRILHHLDAAPLLRAAEAHRRLRNVEQAHRQALWSVIAQRRWPSLSTNSFVVSQNIPWHSTYRILFEGEHPPKPFMSMIGPSGDILLRIVEDDRTLGVVRLQLQTPLWRIAVVVCKQMLGMVCMTEEGAYDCSGSYHRIGWRYDGQPLCLDASACVDTPLSLGMVQGDAVHIIRDPDPRCELADPNGPQFAHCRRPSGHAWEDYSFWLELSTRARTGPPGADAPQVCTVELHLGFKDFQMYGNLLPHFRSALGVTVGFTPRSLTVFVARREPERRVARLLDVDLLELESFGGGTIKRAHAGIVFDPERENGRWQGHTRTVAPWLSVVLPPERFLPVRRFERPQPTPREESSSASSSTSASFSSTSSTAETASIGPSPPPPSPSRPPSTAPTVCSMDDSDRYCDGPARQTSLDVSFEMQSVPEEEEQRRKWAAMGGEADKFELNHSVLRLDFTGLVTHDVPLCDDCSCKECQSGHGRDEFTEKMLWEAMRCMTWVSGKA